jgi:GH25 family lysozyme M1 (1,4-beta-N-acetylmuramidase)
MKRWIAVAVTAAALALPGISIGAQFPDFSNNDPCYCAVALKTHGIIGEIDKANQGTRFVDSTFVGMVADAKRHKLPVGGYDFDELYTAEETYTFVERLKAAGINRSTVRTFPPTLDVEYGHVSRSGLEHQLAVLFRVYGRAQIYTGTPFWESHFGCWVPAKVTFWIAGYPSAKRPCGLSGSRYLAHQFTDHGFNGAGYADLSDFFGSTFNHFIQAVPVQLNVAGLKASLLVHQKERAVLHADINVRQCRKGQHNLPRYPLRLRLKYHKLCGRWIARGRVIMEVEARIEKQLKAATK